VCACMFVCLFVCVCVCVCVCNISVRVYICVFAHLNIYVTVSVVTHFDAIECSQCFPLRILINSEAKNSIIKYSKVQYSGGKQREYARCKKLREEKQRREKRY
jgi:hypothetical protein